MKRICPECSSSKIWSLKDGHLRWTKCRKSFSDPRKRIHIKPSILKALIEEFLLEHSTNILLSRVAISKYMLLKILTPLRVAMSHDLPEVFEGTVEVDEPDSGGNGKIRGCLPNILIKKPNAAEAPLYLRECVWRYNHR